jgi:hypothetical protein
VICNVVTNVEVIVAEVEVTVGYDSEVEMGVARMQTQLAVFSNFED